MFKHTLHAVVPMNQRVLAGSDGSEMGAGRGSGVDGLGEGGLGLGSYFAGGGGRGGDRREGAQQGRGILKVPYMNQMWAPMERRLDLAVFRAMFASSARQGRQFVTHGFVKVNGKKVSC